MLTNNSRGEMQNHWLGKIDEKEFTKSKQLEIKWDEHVTAGLWDWQQNAYALYMEAEALKKKK
jgi:hypothetical protein